MMEACRDFRALATNLDYVAANAILASKSEKYCTYCRRELLGFPGNGETPEHDHTTRDHVWPRRLRSQTHNRNGIVLCCYRCNQEKGEMSPGAWVEKLAKLQDYWGGPVRP